MFKFLAGKLSKFVKNQPIRILVGLWILACTVIANSYGGLFYSILTIPQFDRPIDTADDLLHFLSNPKNVLLGQILYIDSFVRAMPEQNWLYHRLGSEYRRKLVVSMTVEHDNANIAKYAPHFVKIDSIIILQGIKARLGDYFHVGSENINQDYKALGIPKHSPLLQPFNMA